MNIINTVKNIDTDFTVLKSENAAGNVYYIPDRLAMQVEKLEDDKYITAPELQKFIKYNYISQFLRTNKKYFLKGLYPIDLGIYIEHLDIKNLANKIIIKKENLQHFIDFANWWEEAKEIRKKSSEYKRALRKYYGNPSDATKECIAVNYNCSECSHVETCKLLKTEVTKKQFAKAVSMFYGDKETFGKTDLINQIQYLEKKLEKTQKFKDKICEKARNLKEKVSKLEQFKKSVELTEQELLFLDLISQGYSQIKIADALDVSPARILSIKYKLFRKIRTIKQYY